jgi:hypothetical protein
MHVFSCGVRCRFLRIFTIHQRKGGIHEIYRSFMDTFGWYRLAGVRSIKISADFKSGSLSMYREAFEFLYVRSSNQLFSTLP